MVTELLNYLRSEHLTLNETRINSEYFSQLILSIQTNKVSHVNAIKVFKIMVEFDESPDDVIIKGKLHIYIYMYA